MNIDYWLLKLCISINNKNRLRIEFLIKGILRDIWSTSTIKNILFILTNKTFINLIVKIMLKGKSKAKVISFLNDDNFSSMYDVKTMTSSQFRNSGLFLY